MRWWPSLSRWSLAALLVSAWIVGCASSARAQVVVGYPYGGWGGGSYCGPYGGPIYGYPYVDPYGPYVVPPLFLPAETLYGPGAVRRFFGWDPPLGTTPVQVINVNVSTPAPVVNAGHVGNAAGQGAANVRQSNAEARARAREFVRIGDDYFRKQRYTEALNRYREAVIAAPDLAEAYFRQALAFSALGRYDTATEQLKFGLQLMPNWPNSGFQIEPLYDGAQLARNAQLEALAQAAKQRDHDADLLFLLGVQLYFSDQPDRAEPFLRRAQQLTAGDTSHLAGFLARFDPAPAQAGEPKRQF